MGGVIQLLAGFNIDAKSNVVSIPILCLWVILSNSAEARYSYHILKVFVLLLNLKMC